jgi:hypothetical protein
MALPVLSAPTEDGPDARTMDGPMTSPMSTDGWVECRGMLRAVNGERVACPGRGTVARERCLECRFLVSASFDRQWRTWCAADDPVPRPAGRVGPDGV